MMTFDAERGLIEIMGEVMMTSPGTLEGEVPKRQRGTVGAWRVKRCFSGELPLRGADGRGAEMYAAFLRSFRCAVLMEEEQRSMLFWGASAARC